MPKELLLEGVQDPVARENFQRIQDAAQENPFVRGSWKVRVLSIPGAVTNMRVPHGLNFMPKDVMITRQTGAGTVTLNPDRYDRTYIDITTSGAVELRLLIGKLGEAE